MSAIAIILGSCLALLVAYVVYGGWLSRQWGVDPQKRTPARELNDGTDYVPTKYPLLFGHHFASIAGAGPITGPVQAAVFGWVPVLLWILIGGIFFGAVQDFSALLASVRHKGRSLGIVVGKYMGKGYKRAFLIFGWISLVMIIASFTDIVAATFAGFDAYGATGRESAVVASASVMFIIVSIVFGLCVYRRQVNLLAASVVGVGFITLSVVIGMFFPIYLSRSAWIAFICVYVFLASVWPVWILLQPRDYLNSFLLLSLIAIVFFGILFTNPTVTLPPVTGFFADGEPLFPMMFIIVACGAISGFHSLVSSGTTSKQLAGEGDAKAIGFGGMLLECGLSVLALMAVGTLYVDGKMPVGTPNTIFAHAVAGLLGEFGVSVSGARIVITLAMSAFALTTLDTAARVGRYLIQELFVGEHVEGRKLTLLQQLAANKYCSTAVTVLLSGVLALGGYRNVWTLYGVSNQMLATLALLAAAVWLGEIGCNNRMFYIPAAGAGLTSLGALLLSIRRSIGALVSGNHSVIREALQLALLLTLFALALGIGWKGLRMLIKSCRKSKAI